MLVESVLSQTRSTSIVFIQRWHRYWTQRESIDIDFLTIQDDRFLSLVLDFLKSIFKFYVGGWKKDQITSLI